MKQANEDVERGVWFQTKPNRLEQRLDRFTKSKEWQRRGRQRMEELHVSTPAQRPPVDGDSCCSSLLVKWIGGGGQTMDAGVAGTVHSKNKRDVRRGTCNKGYRSDDRMEIADGRTTSKEVHGRSPMEHRLLLFLSQEELEL